MINVTKTFLPPQTEYQAILKKAWDDGWITNRGSLILKLEDTLRKYLDVSNIIVMTNGTLPLQIALKAMQLQGEIITTPFSYVATTSSIVWEGCQPVFVDIHPDYLTIDERKIEAAISPKTSAILATHVFGNPCNVESITTIARKHDLKVIYDAAHCFGVTYKGQSVFNYGDVSTCSFHATKIFHTGEGGALFANNKELLEVLYYHHNFGHDGPLKFHGLGINAKISELQAAMGLAVFNYIDDIIADRGRVVALYNAQLDGLQRLQIREDTVWNNSYFPVIFDSETQLLKVQKALNEADVFPRRYFYPSLDTLPYVEAAVCPISRNISERILCLPVYYGLENDHVLRIIDIILKATKL